jgi:5-methylcytosine-specific restriction endonuclease McrA
MTRERVLRLLALGKSQREIARELGITKSTVAYHARRVLEPDRKFRKRYDWAAIQAYYDAGHSITECQERFGFARKTWQDARRRGAVASRPQGVPVVHFFVAGRARNRRHVFQRLIGAGLKEERCERCGLTEWLGAPICIELHHRNGDGRDNRLENLELLCSNCHSQTDNWGGRGVGRLRDVA